MLQVPLIAGALVLVASGIAKLRDPTPTSRALRAARLPSSLRLVRTLGAAELAAAALALAAPARPAALPLAVLYAGFTAFVLYALGRGLPLASCGCFGKADTPPNALHATFNALVAAGAFAAAITDAGRASVAAWAAGAFGAAAFVRIVTRRGTRSAHS